MLAAIRALLSQDVLPTVLVFVVLTPRRWPALAALVVAAVAGAVAVAALVHKTALVNAQMGTALGVHQGHRAAAKTIQLCPDIFRLPRVISQQRCSMNLFEFALNRFAFERWLHDRIAGWTPGRREIHDYGTALGSGSSNGF